MRYYSADVITKMTGNNVFVFGSNPEGRHGAGAAKVARAFGAIYGQGRGLMGNSYGLVTKNLTAGFVEEVEAESGRSYDIMYDKAGLKSVSLEQIRYNLCELVACCINNPDKLFFLAYKDSPPTLNGYAPREIVNMLVDIGMPSNMTIHASFRRLYN